MVWIDCIAVTSVFSVQQSAMTQGDWEQHPAQDIQHPGYPKLENNPVEFNGNTILNKGTVIQAQLLMARTKLQSATLLPVVIGYLSFPSPSQLDTGGWLQCIANDLDIALPAVA